MNVNIPYQGKLLAGVDEVGRGPLFGAVVAAAVILDPLNPINGLMDSKKISEKKREQLYDQIIKKSLAYGIGRAEAEEIDEINILQASLLAMKRAVLALSIPAEFLAIDGNCCIELPLPMQAIIKGDSLVPAISAASILAKVTRDREMKHLDKIYPNYGLASHKGYPTKMHLNSIKTYGITPLHRKSFKPVSRILSETSASY
jgi:ribonuclease HII